MITREHLKREIDRVQEGYLEILFHIIQTFEYAPLPQPHKVYAPFAEVSDNTLTEWQTFVEATYGILASDPIERGEQGTYEVRETLQ